MVYYLLPKVFAKLLKKLNIKNESDVFKIKNDDDDDSLQWEYKISIKMVAFCEFSVWILLKFFDSFGLMFLLIYYLFHLWTAESHKQHRNTSGYFWQFLKFISQNYFVIDWPK